MKQKLLILFIFVAFFFTVILTGASVKAATSSVVVTDKFIKQGEWLAAYGLPGDQLLVGDYNGDGKADILLGRPLASQLNQYRWWMVLANSTGDGFEANGEWLAAYGLPGDTFLVGDYNGDNKTDILIGRPLASQENQFRWWAMTSKGNGFNQGGVWLESYGLPGDTLIVGDYDDSGEDDVLIGRSLASQQYQFRWWVMLADDSGDGFVEDGMWLEAYGMPGDRFLTGRFNGDDKVDILIGRPLEFQANQYRWWVMSVNDAANGFDQGGVWLEAYGMAGDEILVGDYNNDNLTDLMLGRPLTSQQNQYRWWGALSDGYELDQDGVWVEAYGVEGDTLRVGDFSGDGKTDVALARPIASQSNQLRWWVMTSNIQIVKEDKYEENDTKEESYDLSGNESAWLSSINGKGVQRDTDWYEVYVTSGYQLLNIELTFTHSEGDINVGLYSGDGTELTTSTSTTDDETIEYHVPTGDTSYYVKVYGDDAGNKYDLWWEGKNLPPTIDILEPDGTADGADTSYEITWTDEDPDSDASISLYYDSDNTGEDGTLITSGISEDDGTDSYTWDTSLLASGDYYVYGIIDDGINPQVVDYSDGTVTINHAPTINITEPDGTDDGADTSFNITWTDSDDDNDASISLYYDTDATGTDGTLIASGISENDGNDSYSWNTSPLSTGDYYVYGTINDGVNPEVFDYSDGPVTINRAPTIQITEPDGTNDVADTSFGIVWTDEDTDSDASISLYYDTDNTGTDGTLITSGISENDASDSYMWDTSAIPGGDYYIYGVIDDGVTPAVVDYSDGPVTINHPPSITILEPDGTADITNLSYDITWIDSDTDDNASVSLYYDTDDSGTDGTLIVSGISEDDAGDSYTWDTSALPEADYYVYGIIDDGINPQVFDYSSGAVTIIHGPLPCTAPICNTSFESDFEYWTTQGTPDNQISSDAIDGVKSLYSEHTRTLADSPIWSGVSQEIISVQPAQTYGLSIWVKNLNASQGHVKIVWLDSGGTVSKVDYPITNINGTNSTWTLISKLVTSPVDAVSAKMIIWHGINVLSQNVQGSTLWVDNIEFDVATTACGTLCNENFEHGLLYWTVSGKVGSHTIETAGQYEGLKTLKSEQQYTAGDPTSWAGVTQYAQVKEGTPYRLRLWLKTLTASNGHVRIRWRDSGGSVLSTQYPIGGITGTNSTWSSREASITAPANTYKAEITVWHGVTGGTTNVPGSTLWVDDMTLICQTLCNGGFEDGNVHWETNGKNEGEIVTTNVKEGTNAIKIVQSLGSSDNTQWAGISQRTLVTAGTSYDLSFWIKKENTVQGHVKIRWRGVDDKLISQHFPISGINGTDMTWSQLNTTFVAPAGAETLEIFIWHGVNGSNNNATGSTLYVDDLLFSETP